MCFSAAASIAAGTLLSGATVLTFRSVSKPTQWAFAAIPGIFAIQQFSEALVWRSLSNDAYAATTQSSAFLFLIFAQAVWPVWIPFALVLIEKDRWRRQILYTLLGLGLVLSVHSLYYLLLNPIVAQISGYHVQYTLNYPRDWALFVGLVYGIVTVFPTFVSSAPRMWVVGLPITVSFFFAKFFYPDYIISVWCYFAAIISVVVIYVLWQKQNENSIGVAI